VLVVESDKADMDGEASRRDSLPLCFDASRGENQLRGQTNRPGSRTEARSRRQASALVLLPAAVADSKPLQPGNGPPVNTGD